MGLDSVSDGSYSSWEGICFQGVNFGCELKFQPMFRQNIVTFLLVILSNRNLTSARNLVRIFSDNREKPD